MTLWCKGLLSPPRPSFFQFCKPPPIPYIFHILLLLPQAPKPPPHPSILGTLSIHFHFDSILLFSSIWQYIFTDPSFPKNKNIEKMLKICKYVYRSKIKYDLLLYDLVRYTIFYTITICYLVFYTRYNRSLYPIAFARPCLACPLACLPARTAQA